MMTTQLSAAIIAIAVVVVASLRAAKPGSSAIR